MKYDSIASLFTELILFIDFSGEKGESPKTGKPLHYKGTFFHRIIKGSMAKVCHLFVLCIWFLGFTRGMLCLP